MAYSQRELLARLIKCEAGGEGDNGMRAVASVVMNRVNAYSGEYARISQGGNMHNVVFQSRQFDCADDVLMGRYNPQNIYTMHPEQIHYDIADWAMAGNRLTGLGKALWFFNPYSPNCPDTFPSRVGSFSARIGDHCFYNPTEHYYET